ncbi:hypothetical protein GCM10009641_87340 [Mycobacterium cookii]|uniref:Orc1-like AAA ATPase domain-containing protein n=1 Tax=Nocardioides furvisabuli TaxID=375542 RepID=A0ABN2WKE9_9ACTN|nr:hypothetical protein [Nocardioides furvisabuli]
MDGNGPKFVQADGEKIRDLETIHIPHPGAPLDINRSALLIGSRGSGKTTFLRYRKQSAYPGAIYINLLNALFPITREAGLGGRDLAVDPDLDARIQRKTAALLAVAALTQAIQDDGPACGLAHESLSILSPVLPAEISTTRKCTAGNLERLAFAVGDHHLDFWDTLPAARRLMSCLLKIAGRRDVETLIFLDRAEDAPAACVSLLVKLLDQSFELLCVVASRPGIAEQVFGIHDPTLVPGDHYNIIHLGVSPYSHEWQAFSREAVARYLTVNGSDISAEDVAPWVSMIGRDSIRQMVELAYIMQTPQLTSNDLARQITNVSRRIRSNVTVRMRPVVRDFAAVLDSFRKQHLSAIGGATGQTVLELEAYELDDTVDNKTARLVRRALAAEALHLTEGEIWDANLLPTRFEIPPLLLWDQRFIQWTK